MRACAACISPASPFPSLSGIRAGERGERANPGRLQQTKTGETPAKRQNQTMKTKTTQYQPKTGQPCNCRPGQQRDNCAACEGTGQRIDFAAIRAKAPAEAVPRTAHDCLPGESYTAPAVSEYDAQAEKFLADHGLKFRATLADSKPAPWEDSHAYRPHFRITISKGKPCAAARLTFDFWGSTYDGQKPQPVATAYDALSCISSDITTPDSFAGFCAEFGENEDSRKALQLYRRCDRFAKRLRAFFTAHEIEALQEIR